ncbi:hypothetical protein [Candidatus Cytomitobacter primus]|uniref:Uncharacterized protein n=1 Tax=Candidatus Cytomitobacter primus TaxID=2066024 RepID=A0A5C0UFE2_9PROT|nr:hypothetical protein [Candidatus Cytomitobacter primus]QEK38401.1 hypothetical protein FZC34_00500 [Candidatus Cytomitobacter primus]
MIDPIELINNHNCIIIYGKNEELTYSFFDEFSGSIIDVKELESINLLQTSLLPESNLKIKIAPKDLKKIFVQNINRWNRKCIFLLDKIPGPNDIKNAMIHADKLNHANKLNNIDKLDNTHGKANNSANGISKMEKLTAEINCDFIDLPKFIEFHSKRLSYNFRNMNDLFWVKNLQDLHFAYKIHQIDQDAVSNMSEHMLDQTSLFRKGDEESLNKFWSIMDNPWSWSRYMQYFYQYKGENILVAMCKHLDLWAHKYTPNDEVFIWLLRSIFINSK